MKRMIMILIYVQHKHSLKQWMTLFIKAITNNVFELDTFSQYIASHYKKSFNLHQSQETASQRIRNFTWLTGPAAWEPGKGTTMLLCTSGIGRGTLTFAMTGGTWVNCGGSDRTVEDEEDDEAIDATVNGFGATAKVCTCSCPGIKPSACAKDVMSTNEVCFSAFQNNKPIISILPRKIQCNLTDEGYM